MEGYDQSCILQLDDFRTSRRLYSDAYRAKALGWKCMGIPQPIQGEGGLEDPLQA